MSNELVTGSCESPGLDGLRVSEGGSASGFHTLPSIGGWQPTRVVYAQGIEAEIPQADRREAEELKRKARPAEGGMRPKTK
jgi:hypothetical protein